MSALLITVTIVSILAAVFSAIAARRVIRQEQHRSTARVLALVSAANEEEPAAEARPQPRETRPQFGDDLRVVVQTGVPVRPFIPAAPESPVQTAPLFTSGQMPSNKLTGPLALGAAAVALAIAVAASSLMPGTTAESSSAPAPVAAARPGSLELLGLDHAHVDNAWTISGTVRLPAAEPGLENVSVLAFLIDDNGMVQGTGRATLGAVLPGTDQAAFHVSVAAAGPVARYRIGFRRADGGVIPHFDRRSTVSTQE